MRLYILSALLLATLAAGQSSAGIEITKQRLVKFPEDSYDPNVAPASSSKADEAQRILQQIAKVNEAFGYVKKKPDMPKLPPILDSSQYLFPKPAQSPFHAQQHHFSGSMGQTLLEPSIRAVKLTRNAFNAKPTDTQLYFRPNRVELPAPSSSQESQQLPTHFVIPVHLYKQNKEQYLREHAAEQYRIKGYKIIGDVDSFYGKAKQARKQGKSTPKYHLFFLPRELAFNEDGTLKRGSTTSTMGSTTSTTMGTTKAPRKDSREKLTNKMPTQPQKIPVSVVQDANNRKRVNVVNSPTKPVRGAAKEGEVNLPVSNLPVTSPAIKVTAAPTHMSSTSAPVLPQRNRLTGFRVPSVNLAEMQNQTSTAIKNAFQNIFKLPFRSSAATSPPALASTSNSDALTNYQDDYKWQDEPEGAGDGVDSDIDTLENTGGELDSSAASEKHLFGHKTQQLMHTIGTVATAHQGTQKQALREGGIIIQRLKVRKGGIAIAGPGGVATAGSGGTAIVGPGGYALTHPRSLTIAGPGAKVISIPAEVDLKDALQRTDVESKSFPREGKVVATGPTVYYAPPTGTEEGSPDDVESDFEA
ncbi:uncharacterized protein LOC117788845 isoform X1 [Drosophila innubila]|uniref:uncharacterized protein LOC117788845 isoform X1 n=1 Tax=Drosophila innubila TaxID=198719 RepID=UPI00148CBB55|nr:uncharacterized protein LOC117788845 isoform X1 [Drosophila innubila]XP_034483635.1 uncharacterized protein LOC117788845 isoform X1 [Drosophila innubila]